MVPDFQKQSTRNVDSFKETVARIVTSLPDEVKKRHLGITSKEVLSCIQYTSIPGLVALPFVERAKFKLTPGGIEEALAENVLFQVRSK